MGRASAAVGGYPVAGRSLWRVGGWAPLFDWDFTQQSPGALVLPTGLVFARASSGHSVQVGTNGVIVGGAIASNDVGRIGRLLDAHSYGVFIESPTTNKFGYSNTPSSAPGADSGSPTYTTGQSDPAGGTNATRIQVPSGGYSKYQTLTASTNGVISAWVQKGPGSGAFQIDAPYSGTIGAGVNGTAGALWTRVTSANFPYGGTAPNFVSSDARANATLGSSAGARDCVLYGVQFEDKKYPTSLVLTSGGSSATRAAERLTIDSTRATQSIVGGRLAIRLRFRATAALSALTHTSEGQLFESEDHAVGAWVPSNSLQIIVYANGSQSITASSAITWNAGDLLEFYFELGAGKTLCKWRINGGTWNTALWSVRDDTFAAVSFAGGLDIMNSGGVWQMPGVLERLTTFTPGHF